MKDPTNIARIVKNQFNKQAKSFRKWPVTQNKEYLQAYFDFLGPDPDDTLLDVACGTGELSVFAASRLKKVSGVDISEEMIKLARTTVADLRVSNTDFYCQNIENLLFEDNSFKLVVCKSAFHHIQNYEGVFSEMVRCCEKRGIISIQDIIAYEDPLVNAFFEELEHLIDVSHNITLSKNFLVHLYQEKNISDIRTLNVEIELDFIEYVRHAKQTKENRDRINDLLNHGQDDLKISKYFLEKEERLFFRRNVFLIMGSN